MKITRFHASSAQVSVFEEIEIAFPEAVTNAGDTFLRSRPFEPSAIFADLPVGLNQDWHTAPDRQLVVVMSGRLEVEVGNGEKRQWGRGEMFMADDTTGQGHRTRVLEGPVRLLFLRVSAHFDVATWAGC